MTESLARPFVVPADRRGPVVRLVFALLLAALGLGLALVGWGEQRMVAFVGGLALALFFGLAATDAVVRLFRGRPRLIVDRGGVGFEDAGRQVRVSWAELDSVRCRSRRFRRSVVLGLRGQNGEPFEVVLGHEQLGGATAEWVAGMLETFRARPEYRARLGVSDDAS